MIFAAQCYAWARPMPSHGVCPSVCLSRLSILSKRVNISSIFLPSGSHSSLVCLYQTLWQYSDEDPLTRTSNAGWVGKNRDSRPISGFIACSQRCDRQMLYTQLHRTVASWWHSSLVSGGVCCSRKTDTKCLWQEASSLHGRRQNRI